MLFARYIAPASCLSMFVLGACGGFDPELSDELGDEPGINQPWLAGSEVELVGEAGRYESASELDVSVADESIAKVVSVEINSESERLSIWLELVGVGETTLIFRDAEDGDELHTLPLHAEYPDSYVFIGAADKFEDVTDGVDSVRIVKGGTASIHVTGMWNGGPLYTSGTVDNVVGLESSEGLSVEWRSSLAAEPGPWIDLSASSAGDYTVSLVPPEGEAISLAVEVVPRTAVAALELTGPDTSEAKHRQNFQLAARAYDADGEELLGAPVEWTIEDSPAEVRGDGQALRYRYIAGETKRAVITLGDLSADADFEGSVVDYDQSCSGCAAGGAVGFVPALLALGVVARRRRSDEDAISAG